MVPAGLQEAPGAATDAIAKGAAPQTAADRAPAVPYPRPQRPAPGTPFSANPAAITRAMHASGFRARERAVRPAPRHAGTLPPTALLLGDPARRPDPPKAFDPGPEFRYDWNRLKVARAPGSITPAPFDPGPEFRYDWSRSESARLQRSGLRDKPFDPGTLGLETDPERRIGLPVAIAAVLALMVAVVPALPGLIGGDGVLDQARELAETGPNGDPGPRTGVGNDLPLSAIAPTDPEPPPADPSLAAALNKAADGVLRARRDSDARQAAQGARIGTPLEGRGQNSVARPPLGDGPFHPVRGRHGYGESLARFGAPRPGRIHAGQDVFAAAGTPLVAVYDSIVTDTSSGGGGGHTVILYSPRTDKSYVYYHLLSPTPLRVGQKVRAGEPVGRVGCTGSCFGDHLHFEIRDGRDLYGPAKDPIADLLSWPQAPAYSAP